ncbi:hypothetical protein [Mycolicibacterium sp. A43C]
MAVGAGVGYVKWQSDSIRAAQTAGEHALTTATQTTVTMLSYRPDTVEEDLTSARGLLSGDFLDEYTSLINEVVIPGARDKQITATATVPSAAVVSATADHAVVLVYINQTTTFGSEQPTFSASTARVALDRDDDRWLVSAFSPL